MTWNELKDLMQTRLTSEQMKDDVTVYDAEKDEFFQVTDCHWCVSEDFEGPGAGILDDNHFFLEI